MLTLNVLIAVSLAYVLLLFLVAFVAERRAAHQQLPHHRQLSPWPGIAQPRIPHGAWWCHADRFACKRASKV